MTAKKYVLDSSVLIDFLQQTNTHMRIKQLLDQADSGEIQLSMSMINFCEVLYFVARKDVEHSFEWWYEQLSTLPITVALPIESDYLMAALLKSQGGIAFPDCFAIGLGQTQNATVVTRDQEFAKFAHLITLELHD